MAARSLVSGTISFGLVAIPIRLYPAVVSERVSFHLLHAKCGSRIKYQTYCPVCDQVVDREDLVKGYEFGKEQYIRVTEDELEALEGEASKDIDIVEFVPLASVDPIFLDKAYFLGPDKGGAKPYQLLARALEKAEEVAVARFILRGKESVVLIRPFQRGLILHTMYFHDEIRDVGEIDRGESVKIKESEVQLALRLIAELASKNFDPEKYDDEGPGQEGHHRSAAGPAWEGDRSDGRPQEEPGEATRAGGSEEGEHGPQGARQGVPACWRGSPPAREAGARGKEVRRSSKLPASPATATLGSM